MRTIKKRLKRRYKRVKTKKRKDRREEDRKKDTREKRQERREKRTTVFRAELQRREERRVILCTYKPYRPTTTSSVTSAPRSPQS